MIKSASSHQDFISQSHYSGLDGIRGLAVLGSVLAHAPDPEIWNFLNPNFGVSLFFVISGFLITTLALREERTQGKLNFKAFLVRRAFRLFPVYYVVLGLYALIILGFGIGGLERAENFKQYFWHLAFYFQEVPGLKLEVFYQTWSLGIEEKFYLVWPAIAFIALRKFRAMIRWIGAITFCSLVALTAILAFPEIPRMQSYFEILSGCILAVLAASRPTYLLLQAFTRRTWWLCAVVGATLVHRNAQQEWLGFILVFTCVCIVTFHVTSTASSPLRRIFDTQWLRTLGKYSYAIYLVHLLIKGFCQQVLPQHTIFTANPMAYSFTIYVMTVVGSVISAAILYKYVENPMIQIGRQIATRINRP